MKEKIIHLRRNGYTYSQIRKELNCSKSTISYHCRQIEELRKHRSITEDEIVKINNLYNEGYSIIKIANLFKRSKNTISKYIIDKIKRKKLISNSTSVINYRKEIKKKLVEYKGGSCEICGYNKCVAALQFHHINPLEKEFNISGKSNKFEKLKLEVDKCQLLCSNCHIERHNMSK